MPAKLVLTPEQDVELIHLYQDERISIRGIERRMGISIGPINSALLRIGIKRERSAPRLKHPAVNGFKFCGECKTTKPISDFYAHVANRDRVHHNCKECSRLAGRRNKWKREYGISTETYQKMWDTQEGLCKICNKPETKTSRLGNPCVLAVDHCHATGKIRGLLCTKCNKTLGLIEDNIERCRAIIHYLGVPNA